MQVKHFTYVFHKQAVYLPNYQNTTNASHLSKHQHYLSSNNNTLSSRAKRPNVFIILFFFTK